MRKQSNEVKLHQLAEDYALGFLERGRADWDVPHTRAVVYYAKLLTKADNGDPLVIPTAAWLHDTGYFGIDKTDSRKYDAVKDKKAEHMVVGAQIADEFVTRKEVAKLMSSKQGQRVVHLVAVHDKMEQLVDHDEVILMEADTLGSIDVARVKPSFDIEGRRKYLDGLRRRREPVFRTELGKKILKELIPKFENYKK